MGQSYVTPYAKTLIASTAYTATVSSAALTFPVASSYTLTMVAGAGTGTTPTFDVVLQSSPDGGTTYVDLPLRFTQVTTSASSQVLIFRNGLGENEVALNQVVADTGGTLAKNCNFDPKFMKLKATVTGTNPSVTATFYLYAMPQGSLR